MRTSDPHDGPSAGVESGPCPALVVAGRYRVLRTLGGGGQARVFLVGDDHQGGWYALKVPARDDPARRARFTLEATLMARLAHPNVLRLERLIEVAGAPAAPTELAHGGSLAAWMRRNGALPGGAALAVAVQCADALLHAHARGVLHRDVKPGNILVRGDGSVALADFGVARALEDASDEGRICGSPSFMAPEQWTGDQPVDEKADVYGLAATLHRLWTARRAPDLFRARRCPELLSGLPPPIAALVEHCCRFRAADRPTLAELREELGAALALVRPCDLRATLCDAPIDPASEPRVREDPELDGLRRRIEGEGARPGARPRRARERRAGRARAARRHRRRDAPRRLRRVRRVTAPAVRTASAARAARARARAGGARAASRGARRTPPPRCGGGRPAAPSR